MAATAIALPACNAAPSEPPGVGPRAPLAASLVMKEVVWPSAASLDHRTRNALPPQVAERVAASRVPVLLPPRAEWLAVAKLTAKPLWTSASMRHDGVTVVTTATRAAHPVPGVEPVSGNRKIRGAMGFVTQNERIWSATWSENNVSYAIEVECEKEADARCADETFVMALAETLAYVGGAEARGASGANDAKEGTP